MSEELADEVRRLAAKVASLDRALHPIGPDGLPTPAYRRDRGSDMDGTYWERSHRSGFGWFIAVLDDPETQGHLYVHTPQGMRADPGDVTPVDMDEALWLAGALLAARQHAMDELARKRDSKTPAVRQRRPQ